VSHILTQQSGIGESIFQSTGMGATTTLDVRTMRQAVLGSGRMGVDTEIHVSNGPSFRLPPTGIP